MSLFATDRLIGFRPLVAGVVLSLALAACATPIPPTDIGPAACNAEAARWAIGRAPDADVVERARVETRSRTVRVLTPGMAATMDFQQDRLNIDVNERGAITGLRCG
ncbi:I78 family peptidase inhibitor [Lysobacter antibioticus]|uniref:I78 family peptidase inhibitor n=1 Tax=Lysobacter TaxID=68 RepID=UPI000690DEC8|nr:I78 family peptidase inhibitor [Lysobacter antibioticus]